MALGVFRNPLWPLCPVLKAVVSANAKLGLWQEAQLRDESRDKMGSLKSASPNSIELVGIETACGGVQHQVIKMITPMAKYRIMRSKVVFLKIINLR